MFRPIALFAALFAALAPLPAHAEIKIFGLSWSMSEQERYQVLFDNNYNAFARLKDGSAISCLWDDGDGVRLYEDDNPSNWNWCHPSALGFYPVARQVPHVDDDPSDPRGFLTIRKDVSISANCPAFQGCGVDLIRIFGWLISEFEDDLVRDRDGAIKTELRGAAGLEQYCAFGLRGEELCVTTDILDEPMVTLYAPQFTLEMANGADLVGG